MTSQDEKSHNSQMKFVYHHRTAGRGAEGNHIMSLVHALEAEAHSVTIISPPGVDPRQTAGAVPLDKGAGPQLGVSRIWKWISCHCPGILFEIAEIIYNFYALIRLTPILWRNRTTAAYYERYAFFVVAGVALAKVFGLPVILEVNEVAGVERARKQILVRFSRYIESLILRCADRVVTVSTFLHTQAIARGARPGAVCTMPNAIDPVRFDVLGSGGGIREKYGLTHATVVGFVGWFDEWDRLELLIDAIAQLSTYRPDVRLMLVGDGPGMDRLKDHVSKQKMNGHVILTGPVDRRSVPAYIDAMDICVLPDSNPYGSPMVLLEFMAMAKAVIAPDLLPIRDVIRDGANGRIITRGSVASLREAIAELAGDPGLRSRLGAQARRDVLTNRTWAANARRVTELVREIRKENLN